MISRYCCGKCAHLLPPSSAVHEKPSDTNAHSNTHTHAIHCYCVRMYSCVRRDKLRWYRGDHGKLWVSVRCVTVWCSVCASLYLCFAFSLHCRVYLRPCESLCTPLPLYVYMCVCVYVSLNLYVTLIVCVQMRVSVYVWDLYRWTRVRHWVCTSSVSPPRGKVSTQWAACRWCPWESPKENRSPQQVRYINVRHNKFVTETFVTLKFVTTFVTAAFHTPTFTIITFAMWLRFYFRRDTLLLILNVRCPFSQTVSTISIFGAQRFVSRGWHEFSLHHRYCNIACGDIGHCNIIRNICHCSHN